MALFPVVIGASEPRSISGIYPHLAMFNDEGECGTGAVVPWADRLWVITYAPHKPTGSSDKLYEITPDLKQVIRPESVGGTPANRMIHTESQQLFIGPYVIDSKRNVRVITSKQMFGRHTGLARSLTNPSEKILFATMEEGFYEVDVKTLHVKELWADEQQKAGRKANLPGYHGKGFYSGQGRYIYANNGDHAREALSNPTVPSGVLAEWDGMADQWTIVRRNQFTDVTGPAGIEGNSQPDDPIWSIGWDHRSLLLMVRDHGNWHGYRLPKASHSYDGAHGWNTEWPRIRDIGEDWLLMTMHGTFWKFPKSFSSSNSAGPTPRSNYLKVVGDFCRWRERIVLGCDDTAKSEFLNKEPLKGPLGAPGRSQSNLWFISPTQLDQLGPAVGRGAVWIRDPVKAGGYSDPFLFQGYHHRSLILSHDSPDVVQVTIEVDRRGTGEWEELRTITVPPRVTQWSEFSSDETGIWLRLKPNRDIRAMTAQFQYRAADPRSTDASPIFDGLAKPEQANVTGALLLTRGADFKTLRCVARNPAGELGVYDLDGTLQLTHADDPAGKQYTSKHAAIPPALITSDAASVLYIEGERRWRLPRGDAASDRLGPLGAERICREVCTERNLLNVHGTFYELPAQNAGGFIKLRPVATHNRRIFDYASYRGLLVLSGVTDTAQGEHIIRSDDGKFAVWVGAVDDLWQFGKPRGIGGPWKDTPVKAGVPSDPYLATAYDRKSLTITHGADKPLTVRIEADFLGDGTWSPLQSLTIKPGESLTHRFSDAFSAYWLRLVPDQEATASATFVYE